MGHVLLLYPHHGSTRPDQNILPLGLLYVAASVIAEGHRVTVIDQRTESGWHDKIRSALKEPRTLAVGISSMTGPQIAHGLEMAGAVRELAPELPIVWGGVHPSFLPEQTVRSTLVDIVVMREGEACFPALVNALEKGKDWRMLPGLCYLDNDTPVTNPLPPLTDLEKIPPLPYDLLDLDKYHVSPMRSSRPSLPLVTSRGCLFRCDYCYNLQFNERKWRSLPPERVMREIRRLMEDYHAEGIFLLDDNFFQDRARVKEIMALLVEDRVGVKIYNANCRVDLLSKMALDEIRMMRKAGIEQLFIGMESGSPRVLERIHKDIKVEQVFEVNRKLKDAGIIPVYSFMVGLPDETRHDVELTLDLMMRLKETNPQAKLYKMSLYIPFPGTSLFEQCVKIGNVFPDQLEDWTDYDYSHINLTYLTSAYRRFLEKVSELSGFLDVEDKVKGPLKHVVKAYSKVAVRRCKSRWFGVMPEMAVIQLIRSRQRA